MICNTIIIHSNFHQSVFVFVKTRLQQCLQSHIIYTTPFVALFCVFTDIPKTPAWFMYSFAKWKALLTLSYIAKSIKQTNLVYLAL